jgi:sugar lactone lactonase YvrE
MKIVAEFFAWFGFLSVILTANAQLDYEPRKFDTLAGVALSPGFADGTGSAARFSSPAGIAADVNENIYIADTDNNAVRKMTTTGVVTTLATQFYGPKGIAVDGLGNVFVADTGNYVIRKLSADGQMSIIAGSEGVKGGKGGVGTAARFNDPKALALDRAGNLYVADSNSIRKISPNGLVTYLAGNASPGSVDAAGFSARFNKPAGLTVDAAGIVYVADTNNHTIRKVSPNGIVSTLAGLAQISGQADGVGTSARFNHPIAIALDAAGSLYVTDALNYTLRKVTTDGNVSTLAGLAGSSGSTDGIGGAARFGSAAGVAVGASGNLYVSDGGVARDYSALFTSNNVIRAVSNAGSVKTVAGTVSVARGYVDGRASSAIFNLPRAVASDRAGNLYVGDSENYVIRKISPTGIVSTFAAGFGQFGIKPNGVAVDSLGNVWVADGQLWKFSATGVGGAIMPPIWATAIAVDTADNLYVVNDCAVYKVDHNGNVNLLAGSDQGYRGSADGNGPFARFYFPNGLAVDAVGNVYVADTLNSTIRKITPGGVVTTVAGLAGNRGSDDGTGNIARFNSPAAIAIDKASNLYVADTYTIRKITPAAKVSTLAGVPGFSGSTNGYGSIARFSGPAGIALNESGDIYVGDTFNNVIRISRTRSEAESLSVESLSGGATHTVSMDTKASEGAYTVLNATAAGQYVTYKPPAIETGTYNVRVRVKSGPSRGIFQLYIGDAKQGQMQDEYSNTIGYNIRDLGSVTLFGSDNTLFKFLVYGKNAASNAYNVAFDYIELVPTNRLETESLNVTSITPTPVGYTPAQWYGVFNATGASGGAGTYFNAIAASNYVSYPVSVAKAGTYDVRVGIQKKPNKGIFQLAINELNVGQPQDEYYPSITYGVLDLGPVSFSAAGSYRFKFTVVGKNASSTGYTLAFDYIELVP